VYTRCPQCQTVFRITAAQLKVRDGMVRCGRCQHVFAADRHLMPKPVKSAAKVAPPAARKRAAGKKPAETKKNAPPLPTGPTQIPAPLPAKAPQPATQPLPLVPIQPVRTRSIYWAAGCVLLILLLAGQALIFYGYDFARQTPTFRPIVNALCGPLPCRKLPLIDMRKMIWSRPWWRRIRVLIRRCASRPRSLTALMPYNLIHCLR
jgi:predicted Zn finger-like uncharacterized protein